MSDGVRIVSDSVRRSKLTAWVKAFLNYITLIWSKTLTETPLYTPGGKGKGVRGWGVRDRGSGDSPTITQVIFKAKGF